MAKLVINATKNYTEVKFSNIKETFLEKRRSVHNKKTANFKINQCNDNYAENFVLINTLPVT